MWIIDTIKLSQQTYYTLNSAARPCVFQLQNVYENEIIKLCEMYFLEKIIS